MSSAATLAPPVHATRPNRVAVGTIVWLASELMFFAGLFAMYFTHRSESPALWADMTPKLNVPFALVNTLVLVGSSFACQAAVFAAERYQPRGARSLLDPRRWGMQEWLTLTYVMGSVFVAGQVFEYASLVGDGLAISTNPYGSVFFITTGFHALHVIGGLIAMIFVLGRSFAAKRFGDHEATTTIVVSYYWHFVDVVWIALFSVIYLLK
jgi:cytochrome c oxidase subunit 3